MVVKTPEEEGPGGCSLSQWQKGKEGLRTRVVQCLKTYGGGCGPSHTQGRRQDTEQ